MGGSTTTVSEPVFTLASVLQPFENFEEVYQGQAPTVPVAFPGDADVRAGQTGYASNLLKGVPVPLGARVKIWIPQTLDGYTPVLAYEYQVLWRIQNATRYVADAQQGVGGAYHLPFQQEGRLGTASANRFVMPGGSDVVLYEGSQPSVAGSRATMTAWPQAYRNAAETNVLPLPPPSVAGSAMIWQQGIYDDPNSSSNPGGPSYAIFELEVQGDEFAIWAYKTGDEDWDFAGEDLAFSNTFGTNNGGQDVNPYLGILVMIGVAP